MNDSPPKHQTLIESKSNVERIVRRTFNAPVPLVFDAWSKPELFRQWWVPKSIPMTLVGCDLDVRPGGRYKLTFKMADHPPMDFFGRYIEVEQQKRLVWTNEEGGVDGSTTTVTFAESNGATVVTVSDVYPSVEAKDADGAHEAAAEVHQQLDDLLQTLLSQDR